MCLAKAVRMGKLLKHKNRNEKRKMPTPHFSGEKNRGLALRGDNYLCRQGGREGEGKGKHGRGRGGKKEGCEAAGRRGGLPLPSSSKAVAVRDIHAQGSGGLGGSQKFFLGGVSQNLSLGGGGGGAQKVFRPSWGGISPPHGHVCP